MWSRLLLDLGSAFSIYFMGFDLSSPSPWDSTSLTHKIRLPYSPWYTTQDWLNWTASKNVIVLNVLLLYTRDGSTVTKVKWKICWWDFSIMPHHPRQWRGIQSSGRTETTRPTLTLTQTLYWQLVVTTSIIGLQRLNNKSPALDPVFVDLPDIVESLYIRHQYRHSL
jgi:hypothetical protein